MLFAPLEFAPVKGAYCRCEIRPRQRGAHINTVLGSARAARQLGAESSVDFRKESYSEALLDFSAVVDTLGREKEGAQRMLKEAKGAAYVSLQPKVLKVRRNAI